MKKMIVASRPSARFISCACMLGLLSAGCKEVFEQSLDNQHVVLVAPVDKLVSDNDQQVFYWQPIGSGGFADSTIHYEFQIVNPRFDSVVHFLTDTVLTTDNFTFLLTSGQYEWRVRAFNSSSFTAYTTPWRLTIN